MLENEFYMKMLEREFGALPIAVLTFLYSIEFGWKESFGLKHPIVDHIESLMNCRSRPAKIRDNMKEYKAASAAAVKSVGGRKWKVSLRGRV